MPTILVVDDSAVDRRLVGTFLSKKMECTIEYAASGLEALARMKEVSPDLVVTDLTMPAMDGLELVTAIRARYAETPVILMTAYGSETLALRALEKGAASYVPKGQLPEKLFGTVEEVLSLARAGRSHEHLMRCLTRTEFSFSLENDAVLVDPLVDLIQQMVVGMGLCDFTGQLQIGVALREALLNALFHGNLELDLDEEKEEEDMLIQEKDLSLVDRRRQESPYRDRRIFVDVKILPDEARFVVRDEGPGFDLSTLPGRGDVSALERAGGRGLMLMQTFMDEVSFNERGNEVTLVKRKA